MSNLNVNRFKEMLILLLVCVFSAMLGFVLRPDNIAIANPSPLKLLQQSDEKLIEKTEFGNEPFEFSNLSLHNTKINPHQKFSFSSLIEKSGGKVDDWLDNLKFTLRNVSGKRVTYIAIALDFPETKVNGPMLVYNQLSMGISPGATTDQLQHTTPLVFEPDSTLTFTLTNKQLQSIKNFLSSRNFQLAEINKVVLTVDYLIFEDGMKWQIGHFYKPNPNNPSGYERISPNIQQVYSSLTGSYAGLR